MTAYDELDEILMDSDLLERGSIASRSDGVTKTSVIAAAL